MTFFVRIFIVIVVTLLLLLSCQKKEVANSNSSYDSIEKYRSLFQNSDLPIKQRIGYAQKTLTFIDVNKTDSITRKYLHYLNIFYIYYELNDKYYETSQNLLSESKKYNDTLGLARYFKSKALYFKSTKSDSSYYYCIKSEKLYSAKLSNSVINEYCGLFSPHLVQYALVTG
jgi:hypothetical protein